MGELMRRYPGKPILIRRKTGNVKSDKITLVSLFGEKHLQTQETWVQIQGHRDGGKTMTYKEAYEQFLLHPSKRLGALNCLDLPITDREPLMRKITWLPQLGCCLLRSTIQRWGATYPELEPLRRKLHWSLASTAGATTPLHVDAYSTRLKIEGRKIWVLMEDCVENVEMRKHWRPRHGLLKFKNVFFLELNDGDELIMRVGTPHFVYNDDCMTIGCYFLFAPDLKKFAEVSTICRQFENFTNDEIPGIDLLFHLLIGVSKSFS